MFYLLKTLIVIDGLMVIGLVLFRWALAPQYRYIVSGKAAFLALFTPVVALFSGNLFVFCGYLILAVAFNSRSRAELAATYVFLLPQMPILSVETGIGSIYLLAISAMLAMNLGALIGFATTRGGRSLVPTRYDLGALGLVALFIFIYNRDPNLTILLRSMTINVLGFAAPYLLVSRGIRTREQAERLLLRLSLGGMLTAVTACFQAARHWVLFQTYYEALRVDLPMMSWTLSLRAGLLRTGGSMVDYGVGGLFLAVVVTVVALLRRPFRPAGFWVVLVVLLGGLVATQSRGSWVAAVVGLFFVLAYSGRWARMAMLAGATAGGGAVLLFATSGRLAAIVGRTGDASGTATYRRQLANRGLDQIRDHPLLGQPYDQLVANMPDLLQGQHIVDFVNGHLFIAMAAGLPLFVLWCWVWVMPVIDAWRWRGEGSELTGACAGMVVAAMIALVFTSIVDRNLTWPTIALGLIGPCLALARQSRPARTVAVRQRGHRLLERSPDLAASA